MIQTNRGRIKSVARQLAVSALMTLAVNLFPPGSADQHIPYGTGDVVDIAQVNNRILVHLVYSTPDNFLRDDVYGDLNTCYLRREVAEKLSRAQDSLQSR